MVPGYGSLKTPVNLCLSIQGILSHCWVWDDGVMHLVGGGGEDFLFRGFFLDSVTCVACPFTLVCAPPGFLVAGPKNISQGGF